MTDKSNTAQTLQPPRPGEGGVREQAQAWLAYLYSGAATTAGRRRFSQWLRESPEHAAAYAGAEQLWRDLGLATAAAETPREDDRVITPFIQRNLQASRVAGASARRYSLRTAFATAATLVIATAIVGFLQFYDPNATRHVTGIGEIRTVELADGSEVTLSGASTIVARISEDRRRVELTRGRAYFDVAKDERRVFHVRAAATEIHVVGTRFDVNKSPDGVRVSVTEGRVQITEAPSLLKRLTDLDGGDAPDTPASNEVLPLPKPQATILEPGQQLLAALDGSLAEEPAAFDPDEALSWKQGRLRYVNTRLATVVDEVNRYREHKIVLADKALGDFRVTTSFKTDETDQLLSGLAKSYPVTIARSANKTTVRARP
jgi:transmembrane sensor